MSYIYRRVQTPNYTQDRKDRALTPTHTVRIKTRLCKEKENSILYKDKSSAEPAKIASSAAYAVNSTTIYTGRQTVVKCTLPDVRMDYTPGDSVLLWASNSECLCKALLSLLEIDDALFIAFERVHARTGAVVFSFSGMAADYFRHFMDAKSLPSKLLLYTLSEYASAENGCRDRLRYLSTKEGSADYFGMAKAWNSIADVFAEFSVKVPLEVLLGVCTEIKPRAFSMTQKIGSACEFVSGILTNTAEDSTRLGHFSEYIASAASETGSHTPGLDLSAGLVYRVQHKENRLLRMRMSQPGRSALLVGIGTGVSPFISFIRNCPEGARLTLFYGCRSPGENILLQWGLISGEGERSEYAGARKHCMPSAGPGIRVYVVYSQADMCIRMDRFFVANKGAAGKAWEEAEKTDLYICGNKPASMSVSKYFSENHPALSQSVDDWS
ncbi:uncharacterized protein NEMAJ01_0892 [Nematocida major]|uniref:uncharacterized protein n=1 Tax=Nematocida major TaxID=1912982 RepID=UPI002007EEB1|nr:uncharacterized protein NEMAJ01_0892 [Nematocida major]KAH9385996.1 hypothetical protein NEMAJ01_0892 [Nematocida major]